MGEGRRTPHVPGRRPSLPGFVLCYTTRSSGMTGRCRLQRADDALDHRDAPVLPDRAESLRYPSPLTPSLEPGRDELDAPIGDEVTRPDSRLAEGAVEEPHDGNGGGLLPEDRHSWSLPVGWPEHPPDDRRAEVEPGSGEHTGDATRAHRRERGAEPPDDERHEIRESIHGVTHLDGRVRTFLVEPPDPGGHGEGVTSRCRSVWASDQSRAARSSRIASRSVGG